MSSGLVVVWVGASAADGDAAAERLRQLLEHTPTDTPVIALEPPAVAGVPDAESLGRDLRRLGWDPSWSPGRAVNEALSDARRADVAIVDSSVMVAADWSTTLRQAAESDSTIGLASPLPGQAGGQLERHSADLARLSPLARPRTTPRAMCIYVRRAALDLVGSLDESFETLGGAIADLAQRCLLRGVQHVLADATLVALGAESAPSEADDLLLRKRYPWLADDIEPPASLARSLQAARRAERGLSVTFDARILRLQLSGTQIHVLELIRAVADTGQARVRVVVSTELGSEARELLQGVELLPESDLVAGAERADVVHRPNQLFGLHDLSMLEMVGERIVVTEQDLIAYRNPGYHATPELWRQYRRVTRLGLAMADAVIFSSRHTLHDALADDLIAPERAHVLPIGTRHSLSALAQQPRRPKAFKSLPAAGMLLCLGTDFLHKNRLFAIRLLEALRDRHGWDGGLVLAGPGIPHGSSLAEEDEYLASRPALADSVQRLGAVDEAEKSWLIANATAVVYPTIYEGFGLVPFEAAAAGIPCLWAPVASLAELLPTGEASLVPWDVEQSAERALPLLCDAQRRARHVEEVRSTETRLPDWNQHAEALLGVYDEVLRSPRREASAVAAEAMEREHELGGWNELQAEMGDQGFGLVGPDGYLPPDVQRALLSIVTRPRLRDGLFAALRGFYRAGYRARRR